MSIIKTERTPVGKFEIVINRHDTEDGDKHSITISMFGIGNWMTITHHVTPTEAACLADALNRVLEEN